MSGMFRPTYYYIAVDVIIVAIVRFRGRSPLSALPDLRPDPDQSLAFPPVLETTPAVSSGRGRQDRTSTVSARPPPSMFCPLSSVAALSCAPAHGMMIDCTCWRNYLCSLMNIHLRFVVVRRLLLTVFTYFRQACNRHPFIARKGVF